MTQPTNDFDAAKAIVEQLREMDAARQLRILRWVAESLELPLGGTPSSGPTVVGAGVLPDDDRRATTKDIRSFVESKTPKSDMQFAAVVAYYHKFEAPVGERRDTIGPKDLQEATRLANRDRLKNPGITLTNAKNQGYLDRAGRGLFRINTVGENLVAMTLPGDARSKKGPARKPSVQPARRKRRAATR